MNPNETRQKIQNLLDSGQGENVYIAIHLLVNEFGMSFKNALKELKPIYYHKTNHPDDFNGSIRIANIWIEYEFEKGYVPYMGTEATVSRMVGRYEKDKLHYMEGLSIFLPIEDTTTTEEIETIILEDYYSLIPSVLKWVF